MHLRSLIARLGASSFAHVLLAQLAPIGVSFLLILVTARVLGAAGRGELALMLTIINLLGALLFLSLHVGTAAAERDREAGALSSGLTLASLAGLSLVLAGIGALVFDLRWGILTVGQTAMAVLASSSCVLQLVIARTLQALGASREYRNGILAQSVLFGATGCVLAFVVRTPESVVWAWIAVNLLGTLYLSRALIQRSGPLGPPHAPVTKRIARTSLSAHAGILGQQVLLRADLVILGLLASSTTVGVYSVASPLAGILWIAAEALALLAGAAATRPDDQTAWSRQRQLTKRSVIIGLLGAPVVFGLAALTAAILPGFGQLPLLVLILIPGVIVQGVSRIWLATFQLLEMRKELILAGGISIVLATAYIPAIARWGAVGAAVASLSCYCGQAVFVWLLARQRQRASRATEE